MIGRDRERPHRSPDRELGRHRDGEPVGRGARGERLAGRGLLRGRRGPERAVVALGNDRDAQVGEIGEAEDGEGALVRRAERHLAGAALARPRDDLQRLGGSDVDRDLDVGLDLEIELGVGGVVRRHLDRLAERSPEVIRLDARLDLALPTGGDDLVEVDHGAAAGVFDLQREVVLADVAEHELVRDRDAAFDLARIEAPLLDLDGAARRSGHAGRPGIGWRSRVANPVR